MVSFDIDLLSMFQYSIHDTPRNDSYYLYRRFKALQHLVTIHFALGMYQQMTARYRDMLNYIGSVTRNECTDAINAILDTLTVATDVNVLSEMYEITLIALKSANNERLWFNTNHKLAKLYLDANRMGEVERLISVLKQSCQRPDGTDDVSKGTYLLEVYCLEIQVCAKTRNSARMRQIYPKTLNLNLSVSDPRIMGIIREEGGKMRIAEGSYEEAYNELYEAFRNYQEAGNPRAKDCLKYVVLASMLALSDINPFAAREAKVFSEDKEILAMADLRMSLESNDLARFERILKNKQNRIVDEPFLMTYIEPLRRRMREQVLLNMTRPYTKVTLKFLADELSMKVEDVESLLVDMILEKRLVAHIDQIKGFVTLESNRNSSESKTLQALAKWNEALGAATTTVSSRFY
jgi:COP9 signalosome complex subunit 2